jgi:rhodanese-related sulfurtransferase
MKTCSVREFEEALDRPDECRVIDVREPAEFESGHVAGTLNLPLSALASAQKSLSKDKPVYILCRSGARSSQAARELAGSGFARLYVLEGGLQVWDSSRHPLLKGSCNIWSLDRQMRFTAGALVLGGILLGQWAHPYFTGLALFVAAGLIFSALTDSCGLVVLLSKMPWNRTRKAEVKS